LVMNDVVVINVAVVDMIDDHVRFRRIIARLR